MASTEKETIGIIIIFISITISCIIQLESLRYQSSWLKICTSFNGLSHHIIQMAITYIELILCALKLHVFNTVLIFCAHSTDVANTIMS